MLREPGSRYERTRSTTLLKVKRFLDAEAVVIGHEAGAGRHKGASGRSWPDSATARSFASVPDSRIGNGKARCLWEASSP